MLFDLGSTDYSNLKINLFLCKPDRTIIAKLNEAYDINLNLKAFQLNELEFKLPLEIDYNMNLERNINIDKVKIYYLIKMVVENPSANNEYIEYYQITRPLSSSAEDAMYKGFYCLSLQNELAGRVISHYNPTSFTLEQIFEGAYDSVSNRFFAGVLNNTNWEVEYISPLLYNMYRSPNVSNEITLLDFIQNTLVETYNILPIFNTSTRRISIYSPEEIGKTIEDDILRVSYEKYIQTLDLEEDVSDFTTRLRARGKDNLSLHTVTPTGQPYLENFDFFKYGFEQDEHGNVLSSSPYWSDALCQAQIAFEQKQEENMGAFEALLNTKLDLQTDLAAKNVELFHRRNKLFFTQDILDVLHGLENALHRLYKKSDDDEIYYMREVNPNWYYIVMLRHSNTSNAAVLINGDNITAGEPSNTWYVAYKFTGIDKLHIDVGGDITVDFDLEICRVTEQEYNDDGTQEIQVIFMGEPAGGTWLFGDAADPDSNIVWSAPLDWNISEANLKTALETVYDIGNITVKKNIIYKPGGEVIDTAYFTITFPHALGRSASLVVDFDGMEVDNHFGYSVQEQARTTLLEKYNEPLKQKAFNEQQALVTNKQEEIAAVDADINEIKEELALSNNFTEAELQERNNFIIEKTYSNSNIINPDDLLTVAKLYFEQINEPTLVLNLQLVSFLDMIEPNYDYNKLFYNPILAGIYDTIIVKHEKHNINVACMIVEINWNSNDKQLNFVLSNVREVLTEQQKFLKKMNTSTMAAATVLEEKYKWDGATEKTTELDEILSNTWDAARQAIKSGVNNSVEIDRQGITITNPDHPLQMIRIVAGWIGISSDGGNNFYTAINGNGIVAKTLIGQLMLSAEMRIINEGGNIIMDRQGIKVYDRDEVKRIHIGDLGDFDDPDYVPGDLYGFYFKGATDLYSGQEHYLEWDGSRLQIGGNLDAVTGSFRELFAGTENNNYMHLGEFFHSGDATYKPFIDLYKDNIKRLQINEEMLRFYDETGEFAGYLKAWHKDGNHVLDLGSNHVGTLRSYVNIEDIFRASFIQTDIWPYTRTQLVAIDATKSGGVIDTVDESGIFFEGDFAFLYSDEDIGVVAERDFVLEADRNIILEADEIINIQSAGINLGIGGNTFISIDNINGAVSVQGTVHTTDPFAQPPSVVLHGITAISHIDNSAPTKAYVIRKNGPLPNPPGVINFICP